MYNEKDYKIFEKDNLTLPTAIAQTNESGIATFVLPREEWFTTQSQRFLTFVVQEGVALTTTRYGLPAKP